MEKSSLEVGLKYREIKQKLRSLMVKMKEDRRGRGERGLLNMQVMLVSLLMKVEGS